MKLREVHFYLDWPMSIEVKNLRKHVMSHLIKKGEVIRWAILNVQNSVDSFGTKKLSIYAVLAE